MLVVKNDGRIRTLDDFYGSSGLGSAHHMSSELLSKELGIKFQHVAYRGAAPALTAVIAGEIDFMIENVSSVVGYLESGQLTGLGVTSLKRSTMAPRSLPSRSRATRASSSSPGSASWRPPARRARSSRSSTRPSTRRSSRRRYATGSGTWTSRRRAAARNGSPRTSVPSRRSGNRRSAQPESARTDGAVNHLILLHFSTQSYGNLPLPLRHLAGFPRRSIQRLSARAHGI